MAPPTDDSAEPPPYLSSYLHLRPMIPSQSARYDNTVRSSYTAITLSSGPNLAHDAVPGPWTEHINPEGSPYFFEPIQSIVCEGNLRDPAVLEAVNDASGHILSKLAARIKGGMKDMELYLQLDQNDNTCRYYFVDHIACTLFWLEEVVSSDLGLSTAASPRNMALKLTAQYWTHIEWFGMHIALPESVHTETIAILNCCSVDAKTSTESTSPWSAAEAEYFVKILASFRTGSDDNQGYRNWVIARVRQDIELNRSIHLYGERNARLGSLQSRTPFTAEGSRHLLAPLMKILLFGLADKYLLRLNNLWVDKVIYTRTWRPFAQEVRAKMTGTMIQALGAALASVAVLGLAAATTSASISPLVNLVQALTLTSLVVSGIAAAMAFGVRSVYSGLCQVSAPVANDYLEEVYHAKYGFYQLAVRLSLPTGLIIWSYGTFGTAVVLAILGTLQASWDWTSSPYFFAIPIVVTLVPIIYHTAKVLGLALRSFRRRFTSIALPLHHGSTGNPIARRSTLRTYTLLLLSALLIAAFIMMIARPKFI